MTIANKDVVVLKRLLVNGKKIPVPIPLATVQDAMTWLEEHLLSGEQVITKVVVDQAVLELATGDLTIAIPSDSLLSVTVETPGELSYKMVDAVPNLIQLIALDMKPVAVRLWEAAGENVLPEGVLPMIADLHLLADLTDQSGELPLAEPVAAELKGWASTLKTTIVDLKKNLADGDLRSAARCLLTEIEPCLTGIDSCLQGQKDAMEQAQLSAASRTTPSKL